ncbi:hypothetical protein OUZ56_029563 [Daphnia magna]|uniref:BEN domain-containing protein n=1 Tax=Daphnia magna TaxID=35525 RepID=A0ABR0B783_9CRUS|nr:hypothetical protein OUZ56_029563 [Daphnia magna]
MQILDEDLEDYHTSSYYVIIISREMSKMINVIMEDLWDRTFMSSHSLTGKKAPTDKSSNPPKPALPKKVVEAITEFTFDY